MKIIYKSIALIVLLFLFNKNAKATVTNDDPCDAIALSYGTTCTFSQFDNDGATSSTVPDATCDGGTSDGDVWFVAQVSLNGTLEINTQAGTLTDMGMAVYSAAGCSTLTLISCASAGSPDSPDMPNISLSSLTPGDDIYIRLWDVGNDETGTFGICVTTNCNQSVSITGSTSGCTAQPTSLCTTPSFANYSWSNGSTTSCINVTATGTYSVVAEDNDGCTASASHSFTAKSSPVVSITAPATGCSAAVPQMCVANTFSSYSWSNGGTTACITPASSGTYTVTVSAANACTATDSKAITIYTSPTVSIAGPPTKCSNGSEQLCSSPSTFSSYLWTGGATTSCINPSATGNYIVQVTDNHNCTATSSQSITVNTAPTISVSGPSTACASTSPQLCVGGGYSSYAWTGGETTNCINPATTGTYTATVTDAFGCTATASKSIVVNSAPTVSVTGPASACSGTTAQFCASTGFTSYSWSTGATTTCINPAATGTYTIVVTDANSCTGSSSKAFTVNALPNSAITGPTSTCNGAAGQLCAPAGNSFYLWSNGSTSSCISATTSGTYNVVVTGTNGCTSSSSQSINVNAPFAMTVTGPATACSGSNPQLCASSGTYTYSWSTGATTQCISPSVSGTYTVIATASNGCTKSASKGLTVYTPLNANITGPSSACTGSQLTICASAGSSSYAWSNGATTECIDINSNGIYNVIVSDVNGCTASASKTVTFSSSFTADITGPASGCNGSNATLCVPSGYSTYAWSNGETNSCISVTGPGNYSVTIHDQVGCVANSFYTIAFNPPPVVNISGATIICSGSLANWCATSGYESYLWSNGGTAECINVTSDTVYSVQVTDTNGCTTAASASLAVVALNPLITELNNLLICTAQSPQFTYEWLINGQPTGCTGDTCSPGLNGLYSVNVTDTIVGCTESTTYNYINTGIISALSDATIKIYPNPLHDENLKIDFDNFPNQDVIINISDAMGKIILSSRFKNNSDLFTDEINLAGTAPGLYYLHIQSSKGALTRKLLIQ